MGEQASSEFEWTFGTNLECNTLLHCDRQHLVYTEQPGFLKVQLVWVLVQTQLSRNKISL